MKKRYSEEQIIKAIKQHEARTKVGDTRREFGIYNGTFVKFAKRMPESALVPVTRRSPLGNRAMAKALQPSQAAQRLGLLATSGVCKSCGLTSQPSHPGRGTKVGERSN